jgi:hypothetical protein
MTRADTARESSYSVAGKLECQGRSRRFGKNLYEDLRRIGCQPVLHALAVSGFESRWRRREVLLPIRPGLGGSAKLDQEIAEIEQCLEIARLERYGAAPVVEREA